MSSTSSSRVKPWRDRETLRYLYVEKRLTVTATARRLGCSKPTVRDWLDSFGLEQPDPPWQEEETLRELRSEGLSLEEMGEHLGCSGGTVRNWLLEFDMDTSEVLDPEPWHDEGRLRELYLERELTIAEVASELDCHWHTVRDWLNRHGIETRSRNPDPPTALTDETTLRKLYVEDGLSTYEIAKQFDCAPSTVHDYLRRYRVDTRDVGSQPGELHHRWEGGYDPYYGENWHQVRRVVLDRDDEQCQNCGTTRSEHESEFGAGLDVHHIEPIRSFDTPEEANTLDNLVTLCRGCHNRIEAGSEALPEVEV